MMRSMYSGVSGLKVHQTKMDVIGNNIANVNTTGFKASTVNFSDIFYQTTQSATGPNANTGAAGTNAMQIGLGSNLASITTNVSTAGGAQRTDNPFDLMINGDAFFIVNSGGTNYFTKAGAFTVDAAGTLCNYSGAKVMGWQVDENGEIVKDQVSQLDIMSPQNMYAEPEATTHLNVSGNIDKNDSQLKENGLPVVMSFFDDLGHNYNLKLNIKQTEEYTNRYAVSITDITDSKGESIFVNKIVETDGTVTYEPGSIETVTLGGIEYSVEINGDDASSYTIVGPNTAEGDEGVMLEFSGSNGSFVGINSGNAEAALNEILGESIDLVIPETEGVPHPFAESINIDFSKMTMYATGGVSSTDPGMGDLNGHGAGLPAGEMTGIGVDGSGKIYGTYDNGTKKLLGQIAVATFANPSGLESVGDNMFAETQNSGEFDGVGQDPSTGGGSLSAGVLEMSNVDLASEFTHMITTQRGFQANSRIITTSDTMLEELINLKR